MKKYFYIVAPISRDSNFTLKRNILMEVAASKGIDAHFPLYHSESDSPILTENKNASFVFADISFERPSCYYEIGIAQALQKATFIVALKGTKIHQVEGKVHFYNELTEYKNLILHAINSNNP